MRDEEGSLFSTHHTGLPTFQLLDGQDLVNFAKKKGLSVVDLIFIRSDFWAITGGFLPFC